MAAGAPMSRVLLALLVTAAVGLSSVGAAVPVLSAARAAAPALSATSVGWAVPPYPVAGDESSQSAEGGDESSENAVSEDPTGGSKGCGKDPPATFVGLHDSCTCDVGCDVTRNLVCTDGECLCQPDSVIVNQTCLLKSHYNESCSVDSQCQDVHQRCEPTSGRCGCQPGYTETADEQSYPTAICRPTDEGQGRLGDNCSTVADCNWQLKHASCPASVHVCRCQPFYYGHAGGLQCWERNYWTWNWSWWIAICLLSAFVIATGLALILCCIARECNRSRQRTRGRVITVTGMPSDDNQPPPPYVAVISAKPPAYTPEQDYMDNYGFTPCDLEPFTKEKH